MLGKNQFAKKIVASFLLFFTATVLYAKPVNRESFINFIAEQVEQANQAVLTERALLLKKHQQWQQQKQLSEQQLNWLSKLANRYQVKAFDPEKKAHWEKLLKRVDIVPASLAIAQSINETGWGRSRFAREGNNYFGQWCFKEGCGIVPRKRPAHATYEVAKYATAAESAKSYLHNLNTHSAYMELRDLRQKARSADKGLRGNALVEGLLAYSARGEDYIHEIRAIIKYNDLENFDNIG